MPPRRVLRVRSRVVESNTSSPTAGSDSDVAAPPAAVVKMVEGNSASPITAFDQTGTSNSQEQMPSDKCSPRKVWTGPPSVNGTAKLGEKASEDGQVPPEGEDPAVVAGVHDVMVSFRCNERTSSSIIRILFALELCMANLCL